MQIKWQAFIEETDVHKIQYKSDPEKSACVCIVERKMGNLKHQPNQT